MIDIRRLGQDEFQVLKEVHDGFAPDPACSIAMVAEDAGAVVARVIMVSVSHAEAIWIREDYRGGNIFKLLMDPLELEVKQEGIKKILAFCVKPEIEHYVVKRCGYKRLPWTVLAKELV